MLSNVIMAWGDEQWFCITKNALPKPDREALVIN